HGYRQTNLVSDQPGVAQIMDPNLVNAWGLAAGPTTPLWVADNGTSVATIYPGAAGGMPISIAPLVVSIPAMDPTGQVFNPTMGFKQDVMGTATPSLFIFDTETGSVAAWAPGTTTAVTMWTTPGAIFKGLTLAHVPGRGAMLFAADFGNNAVDVFNSRFHPVNTHGRFRDPRLPHSFAPFGIQAIGGRIYVSYAKQGTPPDEVDAPHLGYVDVYTPRGILIRRLVSRGATSAASAARCSSATSATATSTRMTSTPGGCWGRCGARTAPPSSSTACGACASATASPAPATRCSSARGRMASRTACSASCGRPTSQMIDPDDR